MDELKGLFLPGYGMDMAFQVHLPSGLVGDEVKSPLPKARTGMKVERRPGGLYGCIIKKPPLRRCV